MMTTTYAVAVQKTVPLPTLAQEQKLKSVQAISRDQVLKIMVRVDARLDSKGKPMILVEGLRVDVLDDNDAIDTDKLKAELRKYTLTTPPREEMLLDAKGVTWGMVVSIQDAARAAGVRTIHYPVERKGNEGGKK